MSDIDITTITLRDVADALLWAEQGGDDDITYQQWSFYWEGTCGTACCIWGKVVFDKGVGMPDEETCGKLLWDWKEAAPKGEEEVRRSLKTAMLSTSRAYALLNIRTALENFGVLQKGNP